MQLHEESPENNKSASQFRITPEELTYALAAIEARKEEITKRQEEEERYLAETIPVDEAVRELNLQVTPEEIWAEVQAKRAEAKATAETPLLQQEQLECERTNHEFVTHDRNFHSIHTSSSHDYKPFWLLAASVGLIFWLSIITLNAPQHTSNQFSSTQPSFIAQASAYEPMRQYIWVPGPAFFHSLPLTQGADPTYHLIRVSLGTFSKGYQGVEVRPQESANPPRAIPDGYTVYENILSRPEPGKVFGIVLRSPTETTVKWEWSDTSNSSAPPTFPLVMTTRYNGYEYLRCWIPKDDIPALKYGYPLTLYTSSINISKTAQALTPLTVKLDEISYLFRNSNPALKSDLVARKLNISQGHTIHLDSHAWEDFTTHIPAPYVQPAWAMGPVFVDYDYGGRQNQENRTGLDASSQAVMIKNVPEGQTFHCASPLALHLLGTIQEEASFASPLYTPDSLVDIRSGPQQTLPYTLIKHDGHYYLCGWVSREIKVTEKGQNLIFIYGQKDTLALGQSPIQIEIPLENVHLLVNEKLGEKPVGWVNNVLPDKYAYEKWQP